MWQREEIIEILNQARKIDPKCEVFGASRHQYKLNGITPFAEFLQKGNDAHAKRFLEVLRNFIRTGWRTFRIRRNLRKIWKNGEGLLGEEGN